MMRKEITRFFALAGPALIGSWTLAAAPVVTSETAPIGEAYGIYADTPLGSQGKAPRATIPAEGGMGEDQALSTGVSGVVEASNVFAIATGAGDSHDVGAETSSTAEKVDILNGLITAEAVVAMASSALHGTMANSNADGSVFVGLVVNGMALPASVEPNTKIEVPGTGTVILNEQTRSGDGVDSTGIKVNMIRVLLKDALTGAQTGEIVVGSAASSVSR